MDSTLRAAVIVAQLPAGLAASLTAPLPPDASRRLAAALPLVLDLSREQLLRDRSLLISLGNEIDPAAVPAIGTLLPHLD